MKVLVGPFIAFDSKGNKMELNARETLKDPVELHAFLLALRDNGIVRVKLDLALSAND